jgi:hypothetical protein
MTILERVKAPTPKFFKMCRNIGLVLVTASAAVLTAPVAISAAVITVASYIAVAGSVLSAVSQITVEPDSQESAQ